MLFLTWCAALGLDTTGFFPQLNLTQKLLIYGFQGSGWIADINIEKICYWTKNIRALGEMHNKMILIVVKL